MNFLSPNGLQLQEQLTVTYGIVLSQSESPSLNMLLDPKYWQHHSTKLRPGDKIEVRTEGNLFYAELFVVDVGHMAAKMKVITAVALENSQEAEDAITVSKESVEKSMEDSPGYIVAWVSPAPSMRYGVKREGQDDWVKTGFQTKAAAKKWAADDLKAMAA
jgi:hypothetical protein